MKTIKFIFAVLKRIIEIAYAIVLLTIGVCIVLYYLIFTDELTKSPYGYDL